MQTKAQQYLSHEMPSCVDKTWERDKGGDGGMKVGWGD